MLAVDAQGIELRTLCFLSTLCYGTNLLHYYDADAEFFSDGLVFKACSSF